MMPNHIILHHSLTKDGQTVSWGAIRRYHVETNGWADIGYQLGLELIGDHYEILIGRMLDQVGAHTIGHNLDSIGICFVGNFDLAPPPPDQWALGVRLCHSLCHIFNISPDHIYGHRDFAPKSCPGTMFDLGRFRSEVGGHL